MSGTAWHLVLVTAYTCSKVGMALCLSTCSLINSATGCNDLSKFLGLYMFCTLIYDSASFNIISKNNFCISIVYSFVSAMCYYNILLSFFQIFNNPISIHFVAFNSWMLSVCGIVNLCSQHSFKLIDPLGIY